MMTSQILKFAIFTKTQKFRYLEHIKVFIAKNSFVAEVTFKKTLFKIRS